MTPWLKPQSYSRANLDGLARLFFIPAARSAVMCLSPLKRKGANTASLHPMMTFVPGATPRMEEVPFAVEGDSRAVAVARRIVRDLGAESFAIKKAAKPLYHALGSFSSPLDRGRAGNGRARWPRRRTQLPARPAA